MKKNKKLMREIDMAEEPLAVLGSLQGAEKPTKRRALTLNNMARKTKITFTKKDISEFDRFLTSGRSDLF